MELKNSKFIYSELLNFLHKKESCVLATITSTQGSTPQKSGSSAIIGDKKILAGTLGGGITEMTIEKLATEKIKSKKSGYYYFDLNNKISDADAAICGGNMSVFIDSEPEKSFSVFETLINSVSNRIPGVLITVCSTNASDLSNINRFWLTEKNRNIISDGITSEVLDTATEMLTGDDKTNYRELKFTQGNNEIHAFFEHIVPLPQLFIAGAGHVGKALSHLGTLLEFEVIIWDNRSDYANSDSLPEAHSHLTGTVDDSLSEFLPKKDSFIVIATHGHKYDAEVLKKVINSEAAYIGMIGSQKKIDQIRKLSIENGWATNEQWKKIYAPIGLKIGSKTIQEIAISIAAQLIQVRNQKRKS